MGCLSDVMLHSIACGLRSVNLLFSPVRTSVPSVPFSPPWDLPSAYLGCDCPFPLSPIKASDLILWAMGGPHRLS